VGDNDTLSSLRLTTKSTRKNFEKKSNRERTYQTREEQEVSRQVAESTSRNPRGSVSSYEGGEHGMRAKTSKRGKREDVQYSQKTEKLEKQDSRFCYNVLIVHSASSLSKMRFCMQRDI